MNPFNALTFPGGGGEITSLARYFSVLSCYAYLLSTYYTKPVTAKTFSFSTSPDSLTSKHLSSLTATPVQKAD